MHPTWNRCFVAFGEQLAAVTKTFRQLNKGAFPLGLLEKRNTKALMILPHVA
jgi:hypothetical protein